MRVSVTCRYHVAAITIPLLVLLILSCSKKGTEPGTNNPPDNGGVGILLSGDAAANAVGQTVDFLITTPSIILNNETGLTANKVSVVISPIATVGQVNGLLDSLHARIICMDSASVFLTLSVPAASAVEDIDSITSRLAESEPFLFAFPCYVPISPTPAEPDPELLLKEIPGDPAAGNIAHLKACYMPAAWNANSRANQVNNRVTVLVPDAYAQLSPHAELPGQEFVAIPGDGADVRFDARTNTALGNHGFYVTGILGAEYDDIGATGIHPGTPNLIRIRSLNVGSEEWGSKLQQIADAIPSASQTVVSTGLGYNDPTFTNVSKWQRILLALKWRELVGDKQAQFVHATSSGNDGRVAGEGALSVYNSPFTMAAQMVSPWDWLGAGEYTATDSLGYVQLRQLYETTKPYILQPLSNTLVVGGSNLNGSRSAFSSLGADVRFVGNRVFCLCVTNDATCIDGFGMPSGTSMAAPQAAGLSAYLMNLKAILTPIQAKQVILNSYDNANGIVNSYKAILSLDDDLTNAEIRKSILNVVDEDAGTFDEKDLQEFLDMLNEPQYAKDYSRWDLNGDGWTGGLTTAPFDLNVSSPSQYTTVTPPECADTAFDESAVTDHDILFYYAHSSLYTGDTRIRDSLLPCGSKVVAKGSEYAAYTNVWTETVIEWKPEFRTDTTEARDDDHGDTDGSVPVSASGFSSALCGNGNFIANATAQLTWFVASGEFVTGMSAAANSQETDQTPADSNCHVGWANARGYVDVVFEVRGEATAYTLSASTSVGSGRARMTFHGPIGEIFRLDGNDNGGLSGQLAPGTYSIWVNATGTSSSASATIVFEPLGGASQRSVSQNKQ